MVRSYGKMEKIRQLIKEIGLENILIIKTSDKHLLGRTMTPEESYILGEIMEEVETLGAEKFKQKYENFYKKGGV